MDRKNIVCHHCGKTGHIRKDCYKLKNQQQGRGGSTSGSKRFNNTERFPPPPVSKN